VSIQIRSLENECGTATVALVAHGSHVFRALVHGTMNGLLPLIDQYSTVEMTYDELVSWQVLPLFEDDQSCIHPALDVEGGTTLVGRVHNVTDIGDGACIVDLYVQTGPEFLAICTNELGGETSGIGIGLTVTVRGLCFFPTHA